MGSVGNVGEARASRVAQSDAARMVVLCLGCGALFACGQWGTLNTAFQASLGATWLNIVASQAVFVLAMGCMLMVMRSLEHLELRIPRTVVNVVCTLGAALCLVAASGVDNLWVLCCLWCVMGAALAHPLLFWFRAFLAVYRSRGRGVCIRVITGCSLVSLAVGVPALVLGTPGPAALLLVAMGMLATAALCQELTARKWGIGEPAVREGGAETGSGPTTSRRPPYEYRLTTYGTAVLMSFGETWGLAHAALAYVMPGASGLAGMLAVVAGVLVCLAIMGVCRWSGDGPRFGLIIRLSVAASAMLLAAVPLLCDVAPQLLGVSFLCAFLLPGVAMTFFSVEVCHESGRSMAQVMPLNIIVFFAASAVVAGVFSLVASLAEWRVLWDVFCLLAVAALLTTVISLPSASSTATAFTLRVLPENESYEDRSRRLCSTLVARHGLTEREGEVLELVLQGLTRQEIADRLALSSWTVKDHLGSIYAKVGVHSAKELMLLASGREKEEPAE